MSSLSVIIPFYNDFAFVEQAVDSVLMQGLQEIEIIIVNDNPGEVSESFLSSRQFPDDVKIVTHEVNRGLSAARNTGLKNSEGDLIAYLDADDYFLPDGLARQFEQARITGSDVTHATTILRKRQLSGEIGQQLVARDKLLFCRDIDGSDLTRMPELQFIISSWKSIYRREHLEKTGIVFDEEQRKFEDRLYVLENVFSGASFSLISEPVRIWRRRQGSITTSKKSSTDILMMTNLIDKCTALAEHAVRTRSLPDIILKREVFHSVSRLIWDMGILGFALLETEDAHALRPILERAIGRADIDANMFSDPVITKIDRTGLPNPRGVATGRKQFLEISRFLARGDWPGLKQVYRNSVEPHSPPTLSRTKASSIKQPSSKIADDIELVFHIGLHKTGTTHLQRQFQEHRSELQNKGWLFPRLGFTDHHGSTVKASATPGHQGILRAALDGDKGFRRKLLAEIEQSRCKKILISCENMSFPYLSDAKRAKKIAAIDKYFAAFRNRRVVASIRQPADYFEALYRERVTNAAMRESRSVLQFYATHGETILSFKAILEPWKQFAQGNLDLVSYEALRAEPDFFSAFCRFLGIDDVSTQRIEGVTYASPNRETIELLRLINATMPPGDEKTAMVRSFMNISGNRVAAKNKLSAMPPHTRMEMTRYSQRLSEQFLLDNGLDLGFDGICARTEEEGEKWVDLSELDHNLVLALIHARNSDSSRAVGQGIGNTSQNASRAWAPVRKLSGKIQSPAIKSRLIWIYNKLPSSAKRMARIAYSKVIK